jgi:hypothetical protein
MMFPFVCRSWSSTPIRPAQARRRGDDGLHELDVIVMRAERARGVDAQSDTLIIRQAVERLAASRQVLQVVVFVVVGSSREVRRRDVRSGWAEPDDPESMLRVRSRCG